MFKTNLKILVVDDMAGMRLFISKHLKAIGLTNIIQASDGKVALETLNMNEDISVIFSDVNMPNMSGLEFLKEVRKNDKYKNLPFFIVSAESEKKTQEDAVAAGVTDYIIKPFNDKTLKDKLSKILSLLEK
ncbi:MAG: response regulator [Oligoflexia bacterium]|nr:response regulator [Oligoflexia bacterium]